MRKKAFLLALAVGLCLSAYAQNLEPMHDNKGKFGYGDKESKTFSIKPQWDEARPFNEEGVAIVRKGQMYGLIDKNGKAIGKSLGYSVIAPYDGTDYWIVALGGKRTETTPKNRVGLSAYGFKGSLSYGISGAKWGILRKDGQEVIKPKYQELSDLMAGKMIAYQEKGLLGFLDKEGNVVFPAKYDFITPFNNQGLAAVRSKKKSLWSLVNTDGKVVIPEEEECSRFFSFENDIYGSLNTLSTDSLLVHPELWKDPQRLMSMMSFGISWINSEHPYVVTVKQSGTKKKQTFSYALYDLDGQQIVGPEAGLSRICVPSEGVAIAYKNDMVGFYDISSQAFSPLDDSRVYLPLREGYSMSYDPKTNSDLYLIDKNGNKVSDSYDGIEIAENRYVVRKGNNYGLITRQGKAVVPVECISVMDANSGFFGVKASNGKFGYVDEDGNTIIPFVYDSGSAFVGDYAVVTQTPEGSFGKKSGIIDKKNNVIVPLNYNKVYGYVDNDGKLQVWVAENDNYSKVENFSLNSTSEPKLTATDYTEMKNTSIGTVVENDKGLYGLFRNGTIVIPCSLGSEELVGKVYDYMASHNMAEVSAADARKIAAWTNDKRNSFKLADTIGDNIWDF